MSITKNFLKTRPVCKVKFNVSDQEASGAEEICLVGEFNDWCDTANPMKKMKDGSFSIEIELPSGQDSQFRYRTSNGEWLNDSEADAYVHCPYTGSENSVIKV